MISSFGIPSNNPKNIPFLYWISKLHKNPYKQRFIAGSSSCSTKPLSKLLTTILTAIKNGLQRYSDVVYSRNGVNSMWILKNSKDLVEQLGSQYISGVSSIRTYDFSTLYTLLKSRLAILIKNAFLHKNGSRRYKYIVVNYNTSYFVKNDTEARQKYTEVEVINMVYFLVDNIFAELGGYIYQQIVGIPMGTNCAPLLADLFLYLYEADFVQHLQKSKSRKQRKSFNLTFRYIDDVLSLNNPKFGDYIDVIYPQELQIQDTTDAGNWANYLDLRLEFDTNGSLTTQLYDKRDDFNFSIVNFPFIDSNIPESPAYGVFISQLIRYARVCSRYNDFLYRGSILTSKLLKQGYSVEKLKTAFRKFMAVILTLLVNITFLFHTCYRVCLIIISDLGSNLNCDGCHMWGRTC